MWDWKAASASRSEEIPTQDISDNGDGTYNVTYTVDANPLSGWKEVVTTKIVAKNGEQEIVLQSNSKTSYYFSSKQLEWETFDQPTVSNSKNSWSVHVEGFFPQFDIEVTTQEVTSDNIATGSPATTKTVTIPQGGEYSGLIELDQVEYRRKIIFNYLTDIENETVIIQRRKPEFKKVPWRRDMLSYVPPYTGNTIIYFNEDPQFAEYIAGENGWKVLGPEDTEQWIELWEENVIGTNEIIIGMGVRAPSWPSSGKTYQYRATPTSTGCSISQWLVDQVQSSEWSPYWNWWIGDHKKLSWRVVMAGIMIVTTR